MLSTGRISAIVFKEFKQLLRDKITFAMVVMIPLVQLLLFGYAINTEVRNIPIAVVDMSESAVVRRINQALEATQVVEIVGHYATPVEAEQAIVRGDVKAALVYPVNLTQRLAQGDVAAQWLVDGSDTLISSSIMQLQQLPLYKVLVNPDSQSDRSSDTDLSAVPANVNFEVALFFNPERRSAINIVPGLVAVILTMTMVLFTSTAIVRERERGSLELLITTPIRPIELMIGKIIPYIFIGLIQLAIILGLGHWVFEVPIVGAIVDILAASLLFIAASLALGLIISTVAKTQLQAMQMTIFILLPSILLSGFMFPYEGMPELAQYISELLPATHFIRMIRAVVLRGASIDGLLYDSLWLAGFTAFGLLVASLRFQKTLD